MAAEGTISKYAHRPLKIRRSARVQAAVDCTSCSQSSPHCLEAINSSWPHFTVCCTRSHLQRLCVKKLRAVPLLIEVNQNFV